jgi:hypothetical protein
MTLKPEKREAFIKRLVQRWADDIDSDDLLQYYIDNQTMAAYELSDEELIDEADCIELIYDDLIDESEA